MATKRASAQKKTRAMRVEEEIEQLSREEDSDTFTEEEKKPVKRVRKPTAAVAVEDKKDPLKEKEDISLEIISILKEKNKPMSAQEIHLSLQQKKTVTASLVLVKQILISLGEQERVMERVIGASRIYAPLQEEDTSYNPEEADEKIAQLEQQIQETKERVKELIKINMQLEKEPTAEEIDKALPELEEEIEAKKNKVEKIKGRAEQIDPKRKQTLEKKIAAEKKNLSKRKRIFQEIMDNVLTNMENIDKKTLLENSGIEL